MRTASTIIALSCLLAAAAATNTCTRDKFPWCAKAVSDLPGCCDSPCLKTNCAYSCGCVCKDYSDTCSSSCDCSSPQVRARCPKTCGVCGPFPTPTPTPTPCMDILDNCVRLAQKGECATRAYVRRNCSASCGRCPGTPPVTPTPTPTPCMDRLENCEDRALDGECERRYVRRNCPLSCGRCPGVPPITPTPTPTLTPTPTPSCENRASDEACAQAFVQGICDRPQIYNLCPKTCNPQCATPTPTPSPKPTPTPIVPLPCCERKDKPKALTFRYQGTSCAQSNNPQEGKASCSGSTQSFSAVRVVLTKEGKHDEVIFTGIVSLGEDIVVSTSDKFPSDSTIRLQTLDGVTLQTLNIHLSCSKPLNTGDVYGALLLVSCGDSPRAAATPGCCELDKPNYLEFTYIGGSCADGNNTQQDGKTECSGVPGGGSVSVVAGGKKGESVFRGVVSVGGSFVVSNDGDKLDSNTIVTVGGQELQIHTSCSAPLNLYDRFGSLVLTECRTI